MSAKTKKNIFWPDVSTSVNARSARMYGVWAAALSSIVTALAASWSLGSGRAAYGMITPSNFFDAVIFAAIAFGIYKKSRLAAVAGFAWFAFEKLVQFVDSPAAFTIPNTIFAICLALCYVTSIRGTYALSHLEIGGLMDDKTAIKEVHSLANFELHPRVKFLLEWAWSILALGLVFDAISSQLFYVVPRLEGAPIINRAAFAFGYLLGEIPIIAIAGVIVAAIARVTFVRTISLRIIVVSLALGSVLDALIIYPILHAIYS
jgi:hypothetical protein